MTSDSENHLTYTKKKHDRSCFSCRASLAPGRLCERESTRARAHLRAGRAHVSEYATLGATSW